MVDYIELEDLEEKRRKEEEKAYKEFIRLQEKLEKNKKGCHCTIL